MTSANLNSTGLWTIFADDGEREAKRVRRDKAKADVLSREKALEPPQGSCFLPSRDL